MTELSAYLQGVGLLGPGLDGWPDGQAVLRGQTPYAPRPTVLASPPLLPPAERRRMGRIVKLALAVGAEAVSGAGEDLTALPCVFASSGADGENCHEICQVLASPQRQLSPTRFHNSVHNVAAGYWSIAHGSRAPSNVLCAYDASFAAGLLETLTQVAIERTCVLLIAYDSQYPEPLHAARPIPDAFGVALLLSAERRSGSLARLAASFSEAPAGGLADAALESVRVAIPAARSLPLLAAVAAGESARIVIDYLEPLRLAVEVEPCL
jgi:hypothetical protein